jgi:signal transduction histidine kinase
MIHRALGWSLRKRMAAIAAFGMVTSLMFGGVAMYWASSIEENQMLDARLEQLGATVLVFVEERLDDIAAGGPVKLPNLKTRASVALLYRYQVWSSHGSLLMRSHEAPTSLPMMPIGRYGFATMLVDKEESRVFSLPTKNGQFVIQVAENLGEEWREIGVTTSYYVAFLLVPWILIFGTTWFLMRRSLRDIDRMADQLHQRNPLDLTPIQLDKPPRELLPILASMDTLFDRIGTALSAERRFTSLAAHEMRTPLAGLRAQAQLAGTARDEAELQEALRALRLGVDRASHMLDQLLDLARVETLPTDVDHHTVPVAISDVYQAVMQDLGPKSADKQLSFAARFLVEDIRGHAFATYVLLRNLLANAILYSPAGGRVEVGTSLQGDCVAMTVDDAGPGIRAQDRERAFERFNRLGQTKTEGVGLGLAIVLSVVEWHGARIRLLDSPLGGLRVEVLLRPVEPADQRVPVA